MAPDRWPDLTAHPERLVTDLVKGVDVVGAQPIPYDRLPPRARGAYGSDLETWADLTGMTVGSLLDRPWAGPALVRAVLDALTDAVAVASRASESGAVDADTAARSLIDRLSERDHVLLATRRWPVHRRSVADAAALLGVHAASVLRGQRRADTRFADLLTEPVHQDLLAHAVTVRRHLGALTRPDTARRVLADLGVDPAGETGDLLLHLAGPYTGRDGWWEDTASDGHRVAADAVEECLARRVAPTTGDLTAALQQAGLVSEAVLDFLAGRPGVRRFADRWVRWGASAADKAAAVLSLLGAPAAPETITATIGRDYGVQAVLDALSADDRFHRTTRRLWALRTWGLPEYAGVFGEIADRIDAAGGSVDVDAVVHDITETFGDVAESSVRTFLNAPGFVVADGTVRRRTPADGWPPAGPLNVARGSFHHGPNGVRLAVPIDGEVARGSGRHVPTAVAAALGVHPGGRRTFTGRLGELTVAWRISSTNGANLGSLRGFTAATGADRGDTLVLAFDTRTGSIDATSVRADADPTARLQALLGIRVTDPLAALAAALRCPAADVPALLARRGERHLLEPGPGAAVSRAEQARGQPRD